MAKFKHKITTIRHRDIKIDSLPSNSKPAEEAQQVINKSKEKSKKRTKKDKIKYEKARIKAKHKLMNSMSNKKDIKEVIIDEFTGTRDSKGGLKVHSLDQILNNVELLEAYVNNLLVKYPEYSDEAKKLIDEAKIKSSYNLKVRSIELNNLINEISKNKNRVSDMNNIRYSAYNNHMSYTLYANAIYEVFKDQAIQRGVNLSSFKYCLNSILMQEPWEMYEEEINFSVSTASSYRTRRFKSPQAIFEDAISKCGNIMGISKLKGFM